MNNIHILVLKLGSPFSMKCGMVVSGQTGAFPPILSKMTPDPTNPLFFSRKSPDSPPEWTIRKWPNYNMVQVYRFLVRRRTA